MSLTESFSTFGIQNCNVLELTKKTILEYNFGNNNNNDNNNDDDGLFPIPPTWQCIYLCTFVIILTFVVSSLTGNYSQVDKIWSILPVLYTWIVVCDSRTLLMAILATIWGMRLTWNFSRRGGYTWPPWSGDEDYRWKYIQDGFFLPILHKYKIVWIIFNFGFISLYQNILLLLFVSPSIVAHIVATQCGGGGGGNDGGGEENKEKSPLNGLDAIATVLFLIFVMIESIADNQQYNFQTEKYERRQRANNDNNNHEGGKKESLSSSSSVLTGEFADGFLQSGLFSFVRKPNYAAEQSIWFTFYVFSVAACQGEQIINWSIIGCILLSLLFQMSGWFTEKITLSKYPKYKDYMDRVPLYVPKLFGRKTSKSKSS